jgi:hypothetical protein
VTFHERRAYYAAGRDQGCQSSVQSAAVARNGTELVGLREAGTAGFRAGEMRTDTLEPAMDRRLRGCVAVRLCE